VLSRLTNSESQGQEKEACERPANATTGVLFTATGVLFTATNAVKFSSTVTLSSWALPLSYYRASTFLTCRIFKPKLNKFSVIIVKNQSF